MRYIYTVTLTDNTTGYVRITDNLTSAKRAIESAGNYMLFLGFRADRTLFNDIRIKSMRKVSWINANEKFTVKITKTPKTRTVIVKPNYLMALGL